MDSQKETAVDKDIAIIGEPTTNPATCKFTVDRPVYPGGSAYFGNREAASLSQLAQKISKFLRWKTFSLPKTRSP